MSLRSIPARRRLFRDVHDKSPFAERSPKSLGDQHPQARMGKSLAQGLEFLG
jgi:hypothetical protein